MNTTFFIIACLVMLIGLVGVILPVLPGVPLIGAAAFTYAWLTDFQEIGLKTIIWFAILSAISIILDWLPSVLGVKKIGGSFFGMIGAFVGMILGMALGGFAGLIIGAFIGAFALEFISGKESSAALKSGFGSFVGLIAGSMLKFIIGAVMVGIFVYQILF